MIWTTKLYNTGPNWICHLAIFYTVGKMMLHAAKTKLIKNNLYKQAKNLLANMLRFWELLGRKLSHIMVCCYKTFQTEVKPRH